MDAPRTPHTPRIPRQTSDTSWDLDGVVVDGNEDEGLSVMDVTDPLVYLMESLDATHPDNPLMKRLTQFTAYVKTCSFDPTTGEMRLTLGIPANEKFAAFLLTDNFGMRFHWDVYKRPTRKEMRAAKAQVVELPDDVEMEDR